MIPKGLAITSLALVLAFPIHAQDRSKARKTSPKQAAKQGSDLAPPNFKKCEELLVNSTVRVQTKTGTGTGFAVGDATVIVTNNHVVYDERQAKHAEEITVIASDKSSQKATLLLAMPHRDLAALKVEKPLKPLLLAQEDQFMYHTPVIVMGHGEGVHNLQNTGVLTGLSQWSEKNIRSRTMVYANDTLLLNADATAHHGHSGSPLATPDGLVVGIMSFIDAGNAEANFAVHVLHIRELLEKATPDMKLPEGKLSGVERVRLDKMRRSQALQAIRLEAAQNRKSSSTSRGASARDAFNGIMGTMMRSNQFGR